MCNKFTVQSQEENRGPILLRETFIELFVIEGNKVIQNIVVNFKLTDL